MTKSAAEVMHEVIVTAIIDGLGALRAGSKGIPNALLRDIAAIHPNATFDDMPAELRASIQSSVRAAFTRLQSEGYTVLNPKVAATARPQPSQHVQDRARRGAPAGRPGPRADRGAGPGRGPGGPGGKPAAPRGGRPPRSGGRPPRKDG